MSHLIVLASWTVFCIGFGLIGSAEREDAGSPPLSRSFVFGVVAVFWSLGIIVYMVMPLIIGWIWS